MSKSDKNRADQHRLVGRQFATPLREDEIVQVAGGHPGPGTCTLSSDDDVTHV